MVGEVDPRAVQNVNLVSVDHVKVTPNWATDNTVSSISRKIGLTNQILAEAFKKNLDQSKKEIKDLVDAVNKTTDSVKTTTTSTGKALDSISRPKFNSTETKTQRETISAFRDTSYSLRQLYKSLANTQDPRNLVSNTTRVITDFGKEVGRLGKKFGLLGTALVSFGEGINFAIDRQLDLNRQMISMMDAGTGFSTGLMQITGSALATHMSMDQLTKAMSKHASVTNYLGTGVTNKLISQFNTLTKLGSAYGMTQEQATDSLLDYQEILKNSGMLNNRSVGDLAQSSARYLQNLNELSELTGKTREQTAQQLKELSRDPNFQLAISRFAPTARETMSKQAAGLGNIDPELAKAYKDMVALGPAGLSPSQYQQLQLTGALQPLQEMINEAKLGRDDKQSMVKFSERLANADPSRWSAFAAGKFADSAMGQAASGIMQNKIAAQLASKNAQAYANGQLGKVAPDVEKGLSAQADLTAATNDMYTEFTRLVTATGAATTAMNDLAGAINLTKGVLGPGTTLAGKLGRMDPTGGLLTLGAASMVGPMVLGAFKKLLPKVLLRTMGKSAAADLAAGMEAPMIGSLGKLPMIGKLGRSGGMLSKLFGRLGLGAGAEAAEAGGLGAAAEGAAGLGVGGLAGILGAGALAAGGVGFLGNMGGNALKKHGHKKIGTGVDILADTASGAIAGGAVGSVVPVIGTAIGAGVGALGGLGFGLWNEFIGKKKTNQPGSDPQTAHADLFKQYTDLAGPMDIASGSFDKFSSSYKNLVGTLNSSIVTADAMRNVAKIKKATEPGLGDIVSKGTDALSDLLGLGRHAASLSTSTTATVKFQSEMLHYTKEMMTSMMRCEIELKAIKDEITVGSNKVTTAVNRAKSQY